MVAKSYKIIRDKNMNDQLVKIIMQNNKSFGNDSKMWDTDSEIFFYKFYTDSEILHWQWDFLL